MEYLGNAMQNICPEKEKLCKTRRKMPVSKFFKKCLLFLKKRLQQKQPPEVLCKKSCSWKFLNIHSKTLVLESLFNKVAGLKACNFTKKSLQHRDFPVNIANFLRTSFLRTSENGCFHHNTWIFLRILRGFLEQLYYRALVNDYFYCWQFCKIFQPAIFQYLNSWLLLLVNLLPLSNN